MRRREFVRFVGSGVVAAWPLAAGAQTTSKFPTVGYLWHAGNANEESPYFGAVREGFVKLGYVEGQNLNLIHRFPNEIPENFQRMAAELVAMKVDVLMGGSVATPYLQAATAEIPIVFMFVPDPIGMNLTQSFARPTKNLTGLTNFGSEIAGKRLQVLQELVPGLSRVAFLINPELPATSMYVGVMTEAATQLGLKLRTFEARSIDEIEPAFDAIVKVGMQAVTPEQGGTAFQARNIIPKLALDRRLPLCAYSRETFEGGALVSYGPDQIEMCHRSAVYVDKLLKGAKPGDLPIEQPTKFELLLNLKTANVLDLKVPAQLQQLADEVIE